jgi:hypothetical protein
VPSYQVGESCYPTVKAAALAYGARAPVQVVGTATAGCNASVSVSVQGTDAAPTMRFAFTRVSGTCTMPTTVDVPFVAVECGQYSAADVSSMAWLVVVAWVVAFGVGKLLARAAS